MMDAIDYALRREREGIASALCWRCREGHAVWPPETVVSDGWAHGVDELETGTTIPPEPCPASEVWKRTGATRAQWVERVPLTDEAAIIQRLAEIRAELGPAYTMDPLPNGGAIERRLRDETPEEERLLDALAELTIDRRPPSPAEEAWVAGVAARETE